MVQSRHHGRDSERWGVFKEQPTSRLFGYPWRRGPWQLRAWLSRPTQKKQRQHTEAKQASHATLQQPASTRDISLPHRV